MATARGGKVSFIFCRVCKLNFDNGRKHIFTTRHKRELTRVLKREEERVNDVLYFLRNPRPLRGTHQQSYWCYFCKKEVKEDTSTLACQQSLRHLSGSAHRKRVNGFFREWVPGELSSGRGLFTLSVEGEDISSLLRTFTVTAKEERKAQWREEDSEEENKEDEDEDEDEEEEEEGKGVNSHTSTSFLDLQPPPMPPSSTNMLDIVTVHVDPTTGLPTLSAVGSSGEGGATIQPIPSVPSTLPTKVYKTVINHLGVAQNPSGWDEKRGRVWGGGIVKYKKESEGLLWEVDLLDEHHTASQKGNTYCGAWAAPVAKPTPARPSATKVGNVHTGATPPWLLSDEDVPSPPHKTTTDSGTNPDWLPKFGGVWKEGPRGQSRREFYEEKRTPPSSLGQKGEKQRLKDKVMRLLKNRRR